MFHWDAHSVLGNLLERGSVYIVDMKSSAVLFEWAKDKVHPSASIIKLQVMGACFCLVDQGALRLDERIVVPQEERVTYSLVSEMSQSEYALYDLIHLMIVLSDNTATNLIIDRIGMESVNQLCRDLNMESTVLGRKMMDFDAEKEGRINRTTAFDQYLFFRALEVGDYWSANAIEAMRRICGHQKDTSMIRRRLPENIVVLHKTGLLDDAQHDVGLMQTDQREIFFGIMLSDSQDMLEGFRTIGHIGELLYAEMEAI